MKRILLVPLAAFALAGATSMAQAAPAVGEMTSAQAGLAGQVEQVSWREHRRHHHHHHWRWHRHHHWDNWHWHRHHHHHHHRHHGHHRHHHHHDGHHHHRRGW